MKIEFWSDFRCPICYIAKYFLLEAIEDLNFQTEFEIVFRAFILDPNLDVSQGGDIHESLAKTKGISIEQAESIVQKVSEIALQNRLDMDYRNCTDANTEKAHLLSYFAFDYNQQLGVHKDLMEAYFVENKNIDDDLVLTQIAQKNGLDAIEWLDFSENDERITDLQNDLISYRELGIDTVPFMVINETYAIKGAQTKSYYKEVLNHLIQNKDV